MNYINKLDVFIDEDGKKWHKINSKDYVVMTDNEPFEGTVTLFSTGKHDLFKYVDVEHGIEASEHWSKFTARITSKSSWSFISAKFTGHDKK